MESPISDFDQTYHPQPQMEEKPKRTSMLLTAAKWLLGLLFILILTSIAIGYFFEDNIKAKLIEQINNQLKTELTVGSFQLSLLKGFPKVSAEFQDVVLNGTFDSTAPFIEASSLSFELSVMDIIRSKVNAQTVLIEDGTLSIYINSKGVPNYKVFKSSDNKKSGDFKMGIEHASLKNIEIIYTNKNTDITSMMSLLDASLSGDFSADLYALRGSGSAESHFIDVDEYRFVAGNQLNFDFILDIDMTKNLYAFEKGNLIIDDNEFDITGDIEANPKGFIYDLRSHSKAGNLASALTLLPSQYIESFKGLTSTGTFALDFSYKGQKTATKNPALTSTLLLKNGKITSPHFEESLKNVSMRARFTNGKDKNLKTSLLSISNFKGYFNKELSKMDLEVSNMEDPLINLDLDGVIPVHSIYKFFKQDHITDAKGSLKIKDLKVKGKQRYFSSVSKMSKVKVAGEIEFDDAQLSINDFPFKANRGSLILKGNQVSVKALQLEGADSDAKFSGTFKNFIPVLFADSTNSQNTHLKFNSELVSKNMDFDQLLEAFTSKKEGQSRDEESTGWHSKLSGFLDGSFQAEIANLHYNDVEGADFEGSVDFEDDILTIDGDVESMDGFMTVEGELHLLKRPKLIAEIEGKKINVHKLFDQAENFGQEVIGAKNIKGRMNANMIINAYFDEQGTFLTDELHVYAGLEIQNGELIDFDMLDKFGKYIKRDDLDRIKFTVLENWFEIKKGKIHIPVMFVQNNALNLNVSGKHSFDHDISYNIQTNAIQAIKDKIVKHDKSRRPKKKLKKNIFDLHYTVIGNTTDFDINRNRATVQRNFETSKAQKERIRKVLEDSFGDFDLSSSITENTIKPKPKKETPKSAPVAAKVKKEVIQASLDEGIPEFEVEEDDVEYIEFQGDDGD